MIDLRKLAAIARSSELHDLKVGLTPDEADQIADEIEELKEQRDNAMRGLYDEKIKKSVSEMSGENAVMQAEFEHDRDKE